MDKSAAAEAKLAELTDKVVAASLALRPLCHDPTGLPREAGQVVREVCENLSSISEGLVDIPLPTAVLASL
jgi:hypothetical protein